jgi:hypothetical protein
MEKSISTKCSRCGGTMIYDKFYGHNEDFWGLKCIICGEIIDSVILENRELMRMGLGIDIPRESMYERKPRLRTGAIVANP